MSVVRMSPLHQVVFACIFQDKEKSGPAMLEAEYGPGVCGRGTDYRNPGNDQRILVYG